MASPLNANQQNVAQSMNPLGQPNAQAGPSRPSMPPNFGSFPTGMNGFGQDANNGAQALQARLAAAQQAMLGMQQQQQEMAGAQNGDQSSTLNISNAAALLGNTPGVNNEQMLRQLQAMQASHARLGQQRTSISQASPSSAAAASPSNPLSQLQSSTPQLGDLDGVNGNSLNSIGTGPSITPLQLTQQQKEMLMQHQERLRRSSTDQPNPSTPTNPGPSITTPGGPAGRQPSGPGQLSQQRKQFLQSLGAYYRSLNQPLPPLIFNGERDGEVKILGCWVDMFELFMVIMRAQGVANAIKQTPESETWKKLFANSKLPNPFPEPLPIPLRPSHASENTSFPTTNPVQYLVGLYVAYIKGFEDQMQKHRQQLMQRQQAAQAALTSGRPPQVRIPSDASQQAAGLVGTPRSTSGQAVATPLSANAGLPPAISAPTPPQNLAQQHTPASAQARPLPSAAASTPAAPSPAQAVSGAAPTPIAETTTAVAGTAMTTSSALDMPTSIQSLQANGSSASQTNRPNSSHGAGSRPPPIDTAAAAALRSDADVVSSTPSSARKRPLEVGGQSGEQTPAKPSTPKRQRYKVEYKPIHIPMTNLAGWDERAIRSTFPKYNMGHPTHSIHELGVVDMEAILLGLRSRVPRELGYAITVLSMLSMPHPEDGLDGLPLVHIKDIYVELLSLLDSSAFGEDGYAAWEDKIQQREYEPEIDLASIDFMEYEQIGRHEDIAFVEDTSTKDKWRKERTGGPTDIILSLVNLLRNFSLYEENQAFVGRDSQTFTILSRLIDTRLVRVPGRCTGEQPFSLIEYHSVCRDVIMILTNVSKHVNLALVPKECSLSIYRLILRILSGGLQLHNWRDTPYGPNISPKEWPVPMVVTLYRATEAFYCLAGSDHNREVLGGIVPETELVKLFESMIKLLPNTTRALEGLCSVESDLTHAECTALALYSLTFLSPLSARATMRSIPGAASIIRRIITKLMARYPSFAKSPYSVLCRRLSETLGVLNGTVTCSGRSGDLGTMGFSAGSGDGKGWRWASGIVERGWMADCRDIINECLTMPEVDKHTFAELDALWWAPEE